MWTSLSFDRLQKDDICQCPLNCPRLVSIIFRQKMYKRRVPHFFQTPMKNITCHYKYMESRIRDRKKEEKILCHYFLHQFALLTFFLPGSSPGKGFFDFHKIWDK